MLSTLETDPTFAVNELKMPSLLPNLFEHHDTLCLDLNSSRMDILKQNSCLFCFMFTSFCTFSKKGDFLHQNGSDELQKIEMTVK